MKPSRTNLGALHHGISGTYSTLCVLASLAKRELDSGASLHLKNLCFEKEYTKNKDGGRRKGGGFLEMVLAGSLVTSKKDLLNSPVLKEGMLEIFAENIKSCYVLNIH